MCINMFQTRGVQSGLLETEAELKGNQGAHIGRELLKKRVCVYLATKFAAEDVPGKSCLRGCYAVQCSFMLVWIVNRFRKVQRAKAIDCAG